MGTSHQCRVHVRILPYALDVQEHLDLSDHFANHSDSRIVEMNVGIIVACVSTFPICFANLKTYIQSATTSLRSLLMSSQGKESSQRTHQFPKDSLLQTHESTNTSMDNANSDVQLHDVTPLESGLV